MICDWMTCLECIKCAYFFRLFLSSDFLLGIFSIFHKNVGNSFLPINFQRIVERLFIAGIKSRLKCLNQCSNPSLNMSKKVMGENAGFEVRNVISRLYMKGFRSTIGFGAW